MKAHLEEFVAASMSDEEFGELLREVVLDVADKLVRDGEIRDARKLQAWADEHVPVTVT